MTFVNPLKIHSIENFIQSGSRCKYVPGLYLIATPIGNLEDISFRALYLLNRADIIACEDTRVTKKLCAHYGIKKTLISCHEHNFSKVCPELLKSIEEGKIVVYVTDAGMPLISDPGFELVQHCRNRNLYVTVIPGASAPLSALVLSGLPCHEFYFAGFLPPKAMARKNKLKDLLTLGSTLIFFESPNRLVASLEAIAHLRPEIKVAVARELTKIFEEVRTGTAEELLAHYQIHRPKGEIVLLVGPSSANIPDSKFLQDQMRQCLKTLSLRETVDHMVAETSLPKKHLYQLALELKHGHKKTTK